MNSKIEEVRVVKQTDSQKSMAVSNEYSMDFTDSSSDKHNSSGMETYVLEWDSEGSESPRKNVSIVKDNLVKSSNPAIVDKSKQQELCNTVKITSSSSGSRRSIVAQEIYTQTSKTIIELAEHEGVMIKSVNHNTLETQTSLLSIRENKRVEYTIEMTGTSVSKNDEYDNNYNCSSKNISLDDAFQHSFGRDILKPNYNNSDETISPPYSEKVISVLNKASEETMCEDQDEYDCNSEYETSTDITDIDEDSLSAEPVKNKGKKNLNADDTCETPKSVNDEVAELYTKLYESIDFQCNRPFEMEKKHIGHLTPLVEESVPKQESSIEMTSVNISGSKNEDKDVLFTNNAGIKIKLFPEEQSDEPEPFRLPPILNNNSGHNNQNLDFLFSPNSNKQFNSAIPFGFDDRNIEVWEMSARDLASGESPLISDRSDYDLGTHCGVQLPPIHLEGYGTGGISKAERTMLDYLAPEASPISIKKKIKELKLSHKNRNRSPSKYSIYSRSSSPKPAGYETRTPDAAERSCELLCLDILKKLRSSSWFEITDALIDIPNTLQKYWTIIPEHRIADILRQVTTHVESPRTQIARAACKTLSAILINTNYTKKPDFFEAVTMLLIKTGSFSRPVRHAANIALDSIVCGVHLSEVITVLCIHGATHKSALVRCAAARLLVVCCALGGGGRALLRARPPSAATARKHALRSLAQLLDDKNTDTRKYALRLYSMLRPLTNFEAYYLTDVNMELATTQIKKYDQLLLCGSPEPR